MQFVSVRSRLVLCFATLWCVSGGGVFAAESPRKNDPLSVDPVPAVTREHQIRIEGACGVKAAGHDCRRRIVCKGAR